HQSARVEAVGAVLRQARLLVHWKKSPAALFVPYHCATLSLLRASPGWPSWPPVRRSASHPWTAPCGPTSGRPNPLLRVCQTSASFPLAKSVVFASCAAAEIHYFTNGEDHMTIKVGDKMPAGKFTTM